MLIHLMGESCQNGLRKATGNGGKAKQLYF
nr:MAG TPA: hypothetical protein [Caudoviricetes sp.]